MSPKKLIWFAGLIAMLAALLGLGVWKIREAKVLAGPDVGSPEKSRQSGSPSSDTVAGPVKTKVERSRVVILPSPEEVEAAKARNRRAVNNARQIGLGLFEFETTYGSYPNEETAAAVKQATGTTAPVGAATANDCLHQLMVENMVATPAIFHWDEPGQDNWAAGLEKCGFSYLAGMSTVGDPRRPLLVAPLLPGTRFFDRKVFGGKAVILRVDNSVSTFLIEPDGTVRMNGIDLFDPSQPFWGGTVPPIKWPEK